MNSQCLAVSSEISWDKKYEKIVNMYSNAMNVNNLVLK